MSDTDNYESPKEGLGDHVHKVVRSGLGVIPFGGQAAIELFHTVIAPPLQQRQGEWMNSIADGLRQLEEKQNCLVDDLKDNPAFIDTVFHASQVAMRTSHEDKREALRNAVLNAALSDAPGETLRQIFVSLIDSFSSLHLRLLGFLDDPGQSLSRTGQTLTSRPPNELWPLIVLAFPDLDEHQMVCEHVAVDLHGRGLLIARSLRENVSRYPFFADKPRSEQPGFTPDNELPANVSTVYSGSPTSLREWTTELGKQFVAYITNPTS